MSVIRWSLAAVVGGWSIYLTYLVTAMAAGAEPGPSALRSAIQSILTATTVVVGVSVLSAVGWRRIRAELMDIRAAASRSPGDGLSDAYMADAAELFELGCQAERRDGES